METIILFIGGALAALLSFTNPEPKAPSPEPPPILTPADVRVFEWAGCEYLYIENGHRAEFVATGKCRNGK